MTLCSKCSKSNDRATIGRYCLGCHNGYMREWRKTHRLKGLALKKANARSYLNVYLKRGKIAKAPCEECGTTTGVQGHHHRGYDSPLEVQWLCLDHHRAIHRTQTEGRTQNVKQPRKDHT